MIPDIKEKVEEIGVFYESSGLTPTEARVFALLLLSDPPELDFFAIQEFLAASKSTVSTALKRLLTEGRVEYITRPGERRRYFRVSGQKWLEHIQSRFANITALGNMIDQIIELRSNASSPEFNADLVHIQGYFRYLEQELPRIVSTWEERKP